MAAGLCRLRLLPPNAPPIRLQVQTNVIERNSDYLGHNRLNLGGMLRGRNGTCIAPFSPGIANAACDSKVKMILSPYRQYPSRTCISEPPNARCQISTFDLTDGRQEFTCYNSIFN